MSDIHRVGHHVSANVGIFIDICALPCHIFFVPMPFATKDFTTFTSRKYHIPPYTYDEEEIIEHPRGDYSRSVLLL